LLQDWSFEAKQGLERLKIPLNDVIGGTIYEAEKHIGTQKDHAFEVIGGTIHEIINCKDSWYCF